MVDGNQQRRDWLCLRGEKQMPGRVLSGRLVWQEAWAQARFGVSDVIEPMQRQLACFGAGGEPEASGDKSSAIAEYRSLQCLTE